MFFRHEREHRLLVVLRGAGLDPRLGDTDPQHTGVPPLAAEALDPEAKRTADLVAEVDAQVRRVLADEPKANVVLFRGFDTHRELPGFDTRFGLRAAAVAIYPMYRGIARLLGMDVLGRPADLAEQLDILRGAWDDYDYFFLHHKYTDSAGEDGDRARKIQAIENLDAVVPDLRALVARRDRGERRPLDAVADGRALVAPGAHAALERALRPRRRRAVRREVVPSGRARPAPHQGPHGVHARQRRPPRQVRRVTLPSPTRRRRRAERAQPLASERTTAGRVSRPAVSERITQA